MNINTEFCTMKNKTQQNTNTVSGIFVLIIGVLISSTLLILKHVNVFSLDLEIALAPFVVITLLTYGDKLLVFLFLSPISFTSKQISKLRGTLKSQQQLTLKQS